MRAFTKVCAAAGLALAATGLAPVATAATVQAPSPAADGCVPGSDGYGGELPCEVDVTVVTPVCDNDVPRLRYAVTPVGTDRTTVTIAFVNPGGADVVYADQPLSGTVLWPGAVVDAAGTGVDWPGWRLEDGTWVAGDEFDWVRPSVEVSFQVNPSASAVVAYPPSSPVCLTAPPRSDVLAAGPDAPAAAPAAVAGERAEVLSATGSSAGPLALVASGLVLAGAGGVLAARRRRA
ncbi:LPXTG cell wall anchor domain-containing protein [Cellulomonas dongxiuzhuiae]|uniref:LPXTG cell wall anchor domain-containing protein n=2 Tax=Cellulomonas dongxiuzhuiae TaxID=2819979 RepID=A0ABX8GNU7_9CELL|nr:LPXTG cell wall anchor domain-containing protein [Cellulomonas dongxiuzhuiae]MBO3096375.1 LPXTG cell wall anchor domain-containing protein [Cellulomonas dongxiuzhuiae]QWC17730.1 LPXTG cell wall anchor domain-containing protein [Cellulomonas dongxiuzhuiae]